MKVVLADAIVIQVMNLSRISVAAATFELSRSQNGFLDEFPILTAIKVWSRAEALKVTKRLSSNAQPFGM
jgi:hypothetical protein